MVRGRGGITRRGLLLYARPRTADEFLTNLTFNGDMPRERGGIRRRVGLSYAPHETRNKILDDSTSNGDMPRGRGGNTRKRGLSYAPQGTGDAIVSDSTSNGIGNETSRENVVVTNSISRSTIESSQNLLLTKGRKKLSIMNGFNLKNSSQCSRVITKIFNERIDDGAFTWTKRTDIGAEGMTEGRKQNRNKSKSWKIREIKYRQNITCWNCNQKGHFQNHYSKLVASRDKEVNMAAGDSDNALVCCVENTVEDCIAFWCIIPYYILQRRVRKVQATLRWTLKDVRYIPGLKRRLISYGQLDEEARWYGKAEESFFHNVSEDKKTAKSAAGVAFYVENGIVMLKMVPETPLQFYVAERLSRTFRVESMGIRVEALKMLWADSVITTYLIYRIPYVPIGLRILEEEWRGKNTSLAHLKAAAQMKYDTTLGIRRVTGLSEAEILHLRTRFIELENDSIVAEHGLSSEITQSLGGSSDTSEGSQNSGSFEDSGRSDEEYSEDGASSKEEGSESSQVRRSTRESRAPVRYSPSANYLLLTENGEPDSYLEALSNKESVQWKKAIIEEMVSLKMNETCSLVRLPAGKNASQILWMFMVKEEQDGSKRYKSRLMVKGFQQIRGEPSYVGALNDTSTQHKSEGFQLAGQKENLECRLKKIMYGLIQALRLRYLKFNSFMQKDKALTWQNSTSLSGSFP
ncbi:retrovirus-related pol polyprotein from transposon TNT 1-94 [Tanacetum coccineum]